MCLSKIRICLVGMAPLKNDGTVYAGAWSLERRSLHGERTVLKTPIPMSTQKKESTPAKGQARNTAGNRNSTAPEPRTDAPIRKGNEPGGLRKPESSPTAGAKPITGDRKPTNERDSDTKRPTNSKKH